MTPENQWSELDQYDAAWEDAPETSEFADLPVGEYQVIVDSVEMTRKKETEEPMIKWTMTVIDGEYNGRKIFYYRVLNNPKNVAWMKQDLHKAGLDVKGISIRQMIDRLDNLMDVTLTVRISGSQKFTNIVDKSANSTSSGATFA